MANTDTETLSTTDHNDTQPTSITSNSIINIDINADIDIDINADADIAATCQLPADLDVSSPTTTTHQPHLALPVDDNTLKFNTGIIQSHTATVLPRGWEILVKKRKSGVYKGKFNKYWISPTKEKFNSIKKVR